jgi:hypothetical protein
MTEANFSNKNLGARGAFIISAWITHKDKGALSKIIFGGDPGGDYREVPYEPVTLEVGMAEADFSNKNLRTGGAIIIGAWLTHKDKGAMTSLNLASNGLGAGGAKVVAEAIKVTLCTPAISMAPFSSPSGFSNNCCCLLLSAGYEGTIIAESFEEHPLRRGY